MPGHQLTGALFLVFFGLGSLAIMQDFLHSARQGSAFFFSESLLFKTVWLIFPPVFLLLRRFARHGLIRTNMQALLALIGASCAHLALVPVAVWSLSTLFREQSYGFFKVLGFTLSNDLVVILLVHGAFIVWLRHSKATPAAGTTRAAPEYLTVRSGKRTDRVRLGDILYVKSASPYIAIHLHHKQLLCSDSLKAISSKLGESFVRVHKSSIVNLDHVQSYQSRLNGDYDLTLDDGSQLRLSRNYARALKARIGSTPQLSQ